MNFQAAVTAVTGIYAATGDVLPWLREFHNQPPISVSAETGGAGDDLLVRFSDDSSAEIQVKRGLRADRRLWETVDKLAGAISTNEIQLGAIVVCPGSSATISEGLARDIRRIADGRTDGLSSIGHSFLNRLTDQGISPRTVAAKLAIAVVHAIDADSSSIDAAHQCLARICLDAARVADAWNRLYREAHQVIERRGAITPASFRQALRSVGIETASIPRARLVTPQELGPRVARRVNYRCSYPGCGASTLQKDADGNLKIGDGTVVLIEAASQGGMPHHPGTDCIWMCNVHAAFSGSGSPKGEAADRLRKWKNEAERDAWKRALAGIPGQVPSPGSCDFLDRLRAAARRDLRVLQNTSKWPHAFVAQSMLVDGLEGFATPLSLTIAASTLEDLIIVADPGMGKTSAMLQAAEASLSLDACVAIFVSLGEWATEGRTFFDSILARPAFEDISPSDFRTSVANGNVLLLLDGWNEVSDEARRRIRIQIEQLKAELPGFCFIVSTRKQSGEVPFGGKTVRIRALADAQQLEIALLLAGGRGADILDRARRTPGIRDVLAIPLYLRTLLRLPDSDPFPQTREGLLGRFAAAHRANHGHLERLNGATLGFQQDYLEALAASMVHSSRTSVPDRDARRAISTVSADLDRDGQIAKRPEPVEVLNVLVGSHLLVRTDDSSAIAFPHQQFLEWFASHDVERRIRAVGEDGEARHALQLEILNEMKWEEAILFAIERMANADTPSGEVCAEAILWAFDVDPMLSAEMIYRSPDHVWLLVEKEIRDRVGLWHTPGQVDRAIRFMMNSGRPEFIELIWPLIANEDEQVSLRTLRMCRTFRPSVLGQDARARVGSLAPRIRQAILGEMAASGSIEGMELATAIARSDPDASVQVTVAEALRFRFAYRQLDELFEDVPDEVADRMTEHGFELDGDEGDTVRTKFDAARARLASPRSLQLSRLRSLAFSPAGPEHERDVTALIGQIEIDRGHDAVVSTIHSLHKLYPTAVAIGLLERVRTGMSLFHEADDLLAVSRTMVEEDHLLEIALAASERDHRADAAASVLGPRTLGQLIDAAMEVDAVITDRSRPYDKSADSRHRVLCGRIGLAPAASLLQAIQARSESAEQHSMALFAELLTQRFNDVSHYPRAFSAEAMPSIRRLAVGWAEAMLAAGDAPRRDLGQVALLMRCAPDLSLLSLLQRMLDHNLERFTALRSAAAAAGWQSGALNSKANAPETHQYYRAFLAIDARETRDLMCSYLASPHFGEDAARVIMVQWVNRNDPPKTGRIGGRHDFSHVAARRDEWVKEPLASCQEADEIFQVAEALINSGEHRPLATSLIALAARLPHGNRLALFEQVYVGGSRRSQLALTVNRVLSGELVSIDIVVNGLQATLADTKSDWQHDAWELRSWLQLLPFTDFPSRINDVIGVMPPLQRSRRVLEELVSACAVSPSPGSNAALFDLPDLVPGLYGDCDWRRAVLSIGDVGALRRLIGLVADGIVGGGNDWSWSSDIAARLARFPEARHDIYARLRAASPAPGFSLLVKIVVEAPDEEGLLLLIELEKIRKRSLVSYYAIELLVTERVPLHPYSNTFEVSAVAVPSLRRKIFAMLEDGEPNHWVIRALTNIDSIWDDNGWPLTEQRHPDFASGKCWPLRCLPYEAI